MRRVHLVTTGSREFSGIGRIRSVSNAPGSVWFGCRLHRLKARQRKSDQIKSTHEIQSGWFGRSLQSISGLRPLCVISVWRPFAPSRSRDPLRSSRCSQNAVIQQLIEYYIKNHPYLCNRSLTYGVQSIPLPLFPCKNNDPLPRAPYPCGSNAGPLKP